jgi:hypothetical protein
MPLEFVRIAVMQMGSPAVFARPDGKQDDFVAT